MEAKAAMLPPELLLLLLGDKDWVFRHRSLVIFRQALEMIVFQSFDSHSFRHSSSEAASRPRVIRASRRRRCHFDALKSRRGPLERRKGFYQ